MSKTTWSCHHSRSRNARALSPSQSWAISATLRVPSMASNRRFSLASIGRKMSPQACVRLMKRADPCSPPAAAGLPELRRWEHRLAVLQGHDGPALRQQCVEDAAAGRRRQDTPTRTRRGSGPARCHSACRARRSPPGRCPPTSATSSTSPRACGGEVGHATVDTRVREVLSESG